MGLWRNDETLINSSQPLKILKNFPPKVPKGYNTPYPIEIGFLNRMMLCGFFHSIMFVVEFVEIMSYWNQKKFQLNWIKSSSDDSLVPTVIFYDAESTFSLYGAIHSEQGTMNAFEIV